MGMTTAELLKASGGSLGIDPNTIDKNKGAPIKVRAAVGAAHTAKDKLATIRQWFPDAAPYGDDNFVFTDPETGAPTLYNEEGQSVFGLFNAPTMGDVAGAGIDIATGLGGTVGAVGGGVVGGGLPGGAVGGAAGATLGEQGYDWFAKKYLDTVDTRSGGEKAADAAMTAGLGILSEVGGAALGQGVKATAKAAKPTLENLAAFGRAKVKPTPAMISDSATVRGAEAFGEKVPFAQGPLVKAQERAIGQTEQAAQRAAQAAADLGAGRPGGGVVPSPESAGARIITGAEEAGAEYLTKRNAMDDELLKEIGPNKMVPIKAVSEAWEGLTGELERAPELIEGSVGAARSRLGAAIKSAARTVLTPEDLAKLPPDPKDWPPEVLEAVTSKGTVPYDIMRKARTSLGTVLDAPDAGGLRAEGQAALQGAYGAIRQDILTAAESASPKAGQLQRDLDSFTQAFRGGDKASVATALTKLTDAASPEEAWRTVRSWAYNDASKFQRAVGKLKPAQRDELASAIISDMGTPRKGELGTFSPETYLSNWRQLKKGTKDLLFSDPRHKDLAIALADLETITGGMRRAGKLKNTSNTGNVTSWLSLLGGGGGLGYLADPLAGGGLIGTGIAANVISRAWTSPAFVKALAKFSSTPWWDMPTEVARTKLARHLGSQSWAGDPAEEYIHQLMESMKAPPAQKQGGQ